MSQSERENPLKLPKVDLGYFAIQTGGIGGSDIDVPTFIRREAENAHKLPLYTYTSSGNPRASKN